MSIDGPRLLVDAVQRLSLARTVPDVQAIVRETARELCGADGSTFVLREGDECYYADEDAISPLWKGQRFPLESCISGWAMLHREPVAIEDIYADERIPHEAYRPTFVASLAMVPIRRMDPIGAIGNYWAQHHAPTDEDIALLGALADSTAVAMESVQLWTELEERVADRTARLRAALELNEEILATLAHEIRNALSATVGLLDFSLTRDSLGDDLRQDITYARDAAAGGVRITMDQLAAAQHRAGDLRAHPASVDARRLLDELAAGYRAMRRSDRVALIVDVPDDVPTLHTDPQLLGQALRNLISNALKFTDEGEVRVTAVPAQYGHVAFAVADTGIGIGPTDRERVFETWAQVDDAQANRPQGTGLGLPFVRRIADLLGGELHLDSEPGRGTTITLTLPIETPGWSVRDMTPW